MHESRVLRLSAACALTVALAVPSALGSEIRYPDFPAPRVASPSAPPSSSTLMLLASAPSGGAQPVAGTPALEAVLELAGPPPRLAQFALAMYAALGEPELPSFLRPPTPVHLYNANTHEYGTFHIDADGSFPEAEKRALEHMFRCRRTGRRKRMHPGVLRILADLARHYPGRTLEIVSGYRAPPYGVPHSKHFRGRAIDLRVQGVDIKDVRDYLWQTNDHVGVGYYRGQRFVHVDYRPRDHKIAWTSRRPGATYRYHPRWARR